MNRNQRDYLILGIVIVVIIAGVVGYFVISSENTITIAGSTSAAPVVQALANAYMANNSGVKITVSGGDSGVGINDTRSGSVDIGMSSRNLTNDEAQGLSQYVIGQDALTIIVNPVNPVNDLSVNQVVGIWSGNITDWNQITNAYNGTIVPQTREVGSGTRADFLAFTNISKFSPSVQTDTYNYGILQSVYLEPAAVGYIAHDYANNQVKIVSVNNISPNQQNVENGSYPFTRNLTLLVKGLPTGNVENFIKFCQSPQGQAIVNNVEYNSSNQTYNPSSGVGASGAG